MRIMKLLRGTYMYIIQQHTVTLKRPNFWASLFCCSCGFDFEKTEKYIRNRYLCNRSK